MAAEGAVRGGWRRGWMKCVQKSYTGLVIVLLAVGNLLLVANVWTNEQTKADDQRSKRSADEGPQADAASDGGGATFTRWGRTQCPQEDQLVYAGVAGGTEDAYSGGGSNYLCMPMDPIFGKIITGVQNYGKLHGAEYEVGSSNGAFSDANMPNVNNHNVPCAVCRSSKYRTALMIPARSLCYQDWHTEYHGYLMSAHHGSKGRTEFVCVDHEPEADPAGYRNEDAAQFWHVESVCGSLPCPPYDDGKELTCVVCTK